MKKISLSLFCLCGIFNACVFTQQNGLHSPLVISANQHYLQYKDGTPFFWLGDTAWDLVGKLKKDEITLYLNNRQKKGFNILQVVAIGSLDRPLTPDAYGYLPFLESNPEKPNEKHFQFLDWVISQARKKNMIIGLLPTWGDKVIKVPWVKDEQIIFNEKNAYNYGLFLGKRYKGYSNIIWITGGDKPPVTDVMNKKPVWEAMIKGIKTGAGNQALVTYHPQGEESTTEFWPAQSPLDFNMLQSGHRAKDIPVWDWVRRDYNHKPVKPIVDGESTYEDHPINWKIENGYFRDYDVRKQMYRSVLSGACGVTYGHQALWQFYNKGSEKIAFPDRYWTDALDRPGAFQAGYLKKLMLSQQFWLMKPAQEMITEGQAKGAGHVVASRSKDHALVYLPIGKTIKLDTRWIVGSNISVCWFDPRNGKYVAEKRVVKKAYMPFTSPTQGEGKDWVLILKQINRL